MLFRTEEGALAPMTVPRNEYVRDAMAERSDGGVALITGLVGSGTIVVIGILVMFLWSFWLGLSLALVGVVGAGALIRGKWTSP